MRNSLRCAIAIAVAAACTLASCKKEVPVVTPTPAPPTPTPASTTAQPAQPTPPKPDPAKSAAAGAPLASIAITSATLGNAIDADRRVTAATDTFRPGDTIFVAVETSGTAGGALSARWTFDPAGRPAAVSEETQKVPPGGPAVTEFHVRKPDGWPRGDYQAVIAANGEPLATKRFSVK